MHTSAEANDSGNGDDLAGTEGEQPSESGRSSSTSEAQLAANRSNARRSSGPRSAEGKARSSRNAIRHGAYCQTVEAISATLLSEDLGEVAAFVDAIVYELAPSSVLEEAAARSVAQRILGQARANRFTAALITSAVVDDEPLTPGSARFKVTYARFLNLAIADASGEPVEDPEALAKFIHNHMTKQASMLVRPSNDIVARAPATPEEWRLVLAALLRIEYGGPEAAQQAAGRLFARYGEEAANAERRRTGQEARRALEYFRTVTDLHDRLDRMVARALRDYDALKERNANSTNKLSRDGTTDFDPHEHETSQDDYEEYDEDEDDQTVEPHNAQSSPSSPSFDL